MRIVVVGALVVGCGGGATNEPGPNATPAPAPAPTSDEMAIQAAGFDDEGVAAMQAGNHALASAHFRSAVARVPEARYFFNLCTSLYREGKFSEALTSCNAVATTNATPELADNARRLTATIEADARAQNVPIASTPPPSVGGQAEIAAQVNEEGKQLMFGQRYAEASAKFREAVARVPEPTYFFNLCTSLFQEGKFSEALTSCNAVAKNQPTPELGAKTRKLADKIHAAARREGIDLPVEAPEPSSGQAAIAAKVNDEGKKLMFAKEYAEASAKFRDAVARVPDPMYFFNLCTSLFQEGKFNEALTSCAGGKRNHPAPSLAAKLDIMIQRIRTEARAQNIPLDIH